MRNLKNYTSVNMQILQRQKYNNKSVLLSRKQNLVKWLLNHKGLHKKRTIEGYTYQQERGFDVAEKIAQNEGAGNFSSAGIGLGMMAGIGGTVGSAVNKTFNTAIDGMTEQHVMQTMFCDNCGAKLTPDMDFCEECGMQVITKTKLF